MARDDEIKTLADYIPYWFTRCVLCHRIWCRHKKCDVPACRNVCEKELTHLNCNFSGVCQACYMKILEEFERQFRFRRIQ